MCNISKTIKEQREKLELTQKSLAKFAKTTVINIVKLEGNDFGKIRLSTFLRVLNVLELKIIFVESK